MLPNRMGNVKENKNGKSKKMRLSDWDIFGEPIKLNWNKSESYKTKTGVVFTAFYFLALGYITWMYFTEFIQCDHPNVFESTTNNLLVEDDPDNDLANLFPVISFLDYSQPRPWPKGLPAVPFSDITCHFGVGFGHATSNAWLSLPQTPISLNGDCNEKFKEMYKKITGKEDETLSKTQYLICPDTANLPLLGDGVECQGESPCSYYSFTINEHFGPKDHCNPIDYERIVVHISYINPKLTLDNFHQPWSYQMETEWTSFSIRQSQIMVIPHFFTILETDARSFGLRSPPTIEKKLVRNSSVHLEKFRYRSHGWNPYLTIV
jgi:hypothetical protein